MVISCLDFWAGLLYDEIMKLLVIGFGNMGSAIVKALQTQESPLFESIIIFDRSEEKIAMAKEMGVGVLDSLEDMAEDEVVLLAVKPQDMDAALDQLKDKLKDNALLVSIAAGVTLARLKEKSGHEAVVRVMPNTPALVGQGASGFIASGGVGEEQRKVVKIMLESFGMAIELTNEDQIDMVTALSGSGPAYVFYFLEALIGGATNLGLSEEDALKLAIQTMAGGAELAKSVEGLSGLEQLRSNVTSKGGTTEQAIAKFDEAQLKNIVAEAMKAAYDRAKELG